MRYITLLKIIFILAINANGQNMDTTINKMINKNLILEAQGEELEDLKNSYYSEGKVFYLQGLLQLEYEKITGKKSSNFGTVISFGKERPNKEQQKEINEYLKGYLKNLKECHLLSDLQFSKASEQIKNCSFVHQIQLLSEVIYQIETDEYMSHKKLKLFSAKLFKDSICTGENSKKLNSDIENDKLSYPIYFLKYCNKSILFELANYPEEPENYLEKIHRETASLLDELKFEEFSYVIVLDDKYPDSKFKSYKLIVSLKCNGKTYKQKSFYSPLENRNKKIGMTYFGKIGTQEFYKIFNKILADNQSKYRLHEVKSIIKNAADYSKFGIIALTKEQSEKLHGGENYFTPSYEKFKNNLTSSSIEYAIGEYKKIGLFQHLTEEEISQAKRITAEKENRNFNDVLISYPNVMFSFDMELGNLENPYFELVDEYSKISNGEFNPTNILDDFDIESKKTCLLKFELNGKVYSKELKIESDWIDIDFFEFLNKVVSENHLNGKFYSLYEGGQGASIIYLTIEQYKHLRKNKLIVFEDQWESQQ